MVRQETKCRPALVYSPSLAVPSARAPITVSVFYPLTQVGKRRGGVFLKTGMVAKKQKQDTEVSRVWYDNDDGVREFLYHFFHC